MGSANATNGESPGRGKSRIQRASNRPESLWVSVAAKGTDPPGKRPHRTRTWKPLQIPAISPPRSWNRSRASLRACPSRAARIRPAPRSSPYENPPGIVRIWKSRSAWGVSSRRPTCQVSARAPASSQAAAVSSSQFVPGARKTITRGAIALMVGSAWARDINYYVSKIYVMILYNESSMDV